ncbi:MAG: hypothetical protein Ta2E_01000 [Mycoplasmoidaceae bacterium]|nr:MAG: hypothetical protein Ta2E_01000 [Mycoplasmoidaceae bacterium]
MEQNKLQPTDWKIEMKKEWADLKVKIKPNELDQQLQEKHKAHQQMLIHQQNKFDQHMNFKNNTKLQKFVLKRYQFDPDQRIKFFFDKSKLQMID